MKKYYLIPIILLAFRANVFSQQLTSTLETAIESYVNSQKFTGTVFIARQGKILLRKGYGFSNVERQKLNTAEGIYQVASLAKQFTAAVILKLQEQGKLSVRDRLDKYYPTYPNGDHITIHQLLSHTAGIYDYTSAEAFRKSDQTKAMTLDSMIRYFINEPLTAAPGTRFRYSNSGYTLLGYIIEKVTGKSYKEVLEEMIIRPLKLKHTGYDFSSLSDSNKTTGYSFYVPGRYTTASYVHPSILYTTGALYSNVDDLLHWHEALMGNKFLSAASTEQLYKPVIAPYAYGWFSDSLFGKQRVSHDGNVSGFKANINRFPADDVCVIVLSNSNSSQVGQMVRILVSILYEQPYQLPAVRKELKLADSILATYTGRYAFSAETIVDISVADGKLYMEGPTQPRMELVPETPLLFYARYMEVDFIFTKDEASGNITGLSFKRGKENYTAKKIK